MVMNITQKNKTKKTTTQNKGFNPVKSTLKSDTFLKQAKVYQCDFLNVFVELPNDRIMGKLMACYFGLFCNNCLPQTLLFFVDYDNPQNSVAGKRVVGLASWKWK